MPVRSAPSSAGTPSAAPARILTSRRYLDFMRHTGTCCR